MPVTDPTGDFLTIVRNGAIAHKDAVLVKKSKLTVNIIDILKREGFILNYKAIEDKKQGMVKVYLRYGKDKRPAITGIKRVSKPGLKNYVKAEAIKSVYGGIGVAIISTSKGLMVDQEARKNNLGGELLCQVW